MRYWVVTDDGTRSGGARTCIGAELLALRISVIAWWRGRPQRLWIFTNWRDDE